METRTLSIIALVFAVVALLVSVYLWSRPVAFAPLPPVTGPGAANIPTPPVGAEGLDAAQQPTVPQPPVPQR